MNLQPKHAVAAALLAVFGAVSGFVGHQLDQHPKIQSALTDAANDVEATRYFRALGLSCGVESWAVKTMQDSAASSVNLTPKPTNIPTLIAKTAPAGTRTEPQAYSLNGTRLTGYKLEGDSDIHLILTSTLGSHPTMIVEIPSPGCTTNLGGSVVQAQITAARAAFVQQVGQPQTSFTTVNIPVSLTGIPFTDFAHGQNGADPNQQELHPIIAFKRLK